MIIWRGWGILAFMYTLLGAAIGAAGGFAHGWYLNVVSPKKKAEQWESQERVRLRQVVESGGLVYNNTAPQTAAEADQVIEAIVAQGRAQFKRLGYHSVFWIPIQWISVVFAIICVIIAVVGIAG